ncbi:TetR family transcriptional regulator C-terminal domain-containing protein [Aliiroseovarius sp.]|uniref:TetR family transcriptional regulator C-terminal domain-containing protein n=1 Tax=Aliiroseovarius sp. TaxID=1872442 RepID=UPI003BACF183
MANARPRTRIQERNRATILEAALEVFSRHGFRGSTLDQIAQEAGLSKPNLLYYFPSKDAIHAELLSGLMESWLEPLKALKDDGDPVDEIIAYVLRKLDMARDLPRESRLFANEIVQGAPRIHDQIEGPLKTLVDDKVQVMRGWIAAGRLADVDPYHLIFSIWSTTQHYADFDTQVRAILTPTADEHFAEAARFLDHLYRCALTPR